MQAEPAQRGYGILGYRQQSGGAGGQKGCRIRRNLGQPQRLAAARCHQRREFAVADADTGQQGLRKGIKQGAGQHLIAAVQRFQPVHSHVGDAQPGVLHSVANSLQGAYGLLEHPAVVWLVRFQNQGSGLARQGLFQGHPC